MQGWVREHTSAPFWASSSDLSLETMACIMHHHLHPLRCPSQLQRLVRWGLLEPRVEYLPLLWNRPLVELPTMCFFLPSWRMASSPDLIDQHYCYFCFDLESFPKSVKPPTHPRVFVRFGNTKGEIRVKKGDFRDDKLRLRRWYLNILLLDQW